MGSKLYRYALLYGFNKYDIDITGYVHTTPNGVEVVADRDDATEFSWENKPKRKGWGSPKQWCDFFNTEDELSDWKFHVVKCTRRKR